jgi:5-methylcytosine-specific restriction endonuclease McrA
MAAVWREGAAGWYVYRFDPKKDYGAWLETDEWQAIREKALERAEHCCADCGSERGLEVHHLTYRNLGAERPEDLVVVCSDCHVERHVGPPC